MILQNVSLLNGSGNFILRSCNRAFGSRERIGILAASGSGKSTLARALSGIEAPWSGNISTNSTVSWPLGYAGFLHPNLTVGQNLETISGLVGKNRTHFTSNVAALAELTNDLGKPMRVVNPTQRATLAYMCAMATPAELLIADDTLTVGGSRLRLKCEAILELRLQNSGLIFLSRNARQIDTYCSRFFVLSQQQLIECASVKTAQMLLEKELAYA